MKKISFLIVIFICMADAALAVTQEGGLFICLKIRQCNTKTAQYRKGLFSKDFWTILMMLIKIRIIRNLYFSIIGGPHYSTDTKLGRWTGGSGALSC